MAVRQQNEACDALRNFVSGPLEFAHDTAEISNFAYFIGRTLQPVIEGLARCRPELASLTYVTGSGDEHMFTGPEARNRWMAGAYGLHAIFGIHPPVSRKVRNDMLIQKHEPGKPWIVSVSQMQRTMPDISREEVGVMSGVSLCMQSADPTKDLYDYLFNSGRLAGTEEKFEHYVLDQTATAQPPLSDLPLVRKIAGEQAAGIYEMHGAPGLFQYRMYQALGEVCSDLRLT